MIQLYLRLIPLPGCSEETLRALRAILLPLQRAKGFLHSRFYKEDGEKTAVCCEVDWATSEDLDRQIRSDAFSRLLAIMESSEELPTLEFRFVSGTRGLDYVAALRTPAPSPTCPSGTAHSSQEGEEQ